jgi:hypothetical protein
MKRESMRRERISKEEGEKQTYHREYIQDKDDFVSPPSHYKTLFSFRAYFRLPLPALPVSFRDCVFPIAHSTACFPLFPLRQIIKCTSAYFPGSGFITNLIYIHIYIYIYISWDMDTLFEQSWST